MEIKILANYAPFWINNTFFPIRLTTWLLQVEASFTSLQSSTRCGRFFLSTGALPRFSSWSHLFNIEWLFSSLRAIWEVCGSLFAFFRHVPRAFHFWPLLCALGRVRRHLGYDMTEEVDWEAAWSNMVENGVVEDRFSNTVAEATIDEYVSRHTFCTESFSDWQLSSFLFKVGKRGWVECCESNAIVW